MADARLYSLLAPIDGDRSLWSGTRVHESIFPKHLDPRADLDLRRTVIRLRQQGRSRAPFNAGDADNDSATLAAAGSPAKPVSVEMTIAASGTQTRRNLRFTKMHGIGNDFVIIDGRVDPAPIDADLVRQLGDRQRGIGFDQLLRIGVASDPTCQFSYAIWNRNGSTAAQCGNGVRCVAAWLHREGVLGDGAVRLESPIGAVEVQMLADGSVRVEMGEPQFSVSAIGLRVADEADRYAINLPSGRVEFGAVSLGNPHAVIAVDDVAAAPVDTLGPAISHAEKFDRQCNVGFVELRSRNRIGLRVWERGVGETLACGSGACAAVAVMRQRDLVDADVTVSLPGGELQIHWQGSGHSLAMAGPATFVFDGEWIA
ncbi:MAG: diaminopimelate epimerase [Dokdonella sp.]